ncbi:hypothetical protein ACOSQ2_027736 [Xanthoceras sorbifolium]
MADPKQKETLNTASQLTAATVPPPQDSAAAKPQPQPNKRKLSDDDSDNADFHNSPYFKLRALARQIRPHFTEILRTPDFRNCKAALEIRMQMELMVVLYKQMIEHRPSAGENLLGRRFSGGREEGKESLKEKSETTPDKVGQRRESYVVGGSVFGWNYITFLGSKPVYYGVTKESFRSSSNHDKPLADTN